VATGAGFTALLLLGIAMTAWQAIRATNAELLASGQHDLAVVAHDEAARERDDANRANGALRHLAAEQRRTLYATSMNLAQAAWESGDSARTLELLRQWLPKPGEDDLRGFEWYYWNRFAHQDLETLRMTRFDEVCFNGRGARLSPDGRRVAAFTSDPAGATALKLWDADTGRVLWAVPVAADSRRSRSPAPKSGAWRSVRTARALPRRSTAGRSNKSSSGTPRAVGSCGC
jgi:hypothetical protein